MPSRRGARNDINHQLGALLRQRRRALGWSQVRLANQVGVQGETISRIERGLHMPSLKKLSELCRTLRVSLARLIAEIENDNRDELPALRDLLGDLDADDRAFVLDTAARCARHLRARRAH